ncbi:MAG: nucleotidyltransferase domain-containing protein [Chloroflexota bacterium]
MGKGTRQAGPRGTGDARVNLDLPVDAAALATFCRRHNIKRLSLFGSRVKGTARPDSDFDLLVEFAPGKSPSLIGLAAMEGELSVLTGGARIDLRTPAELSRYFRDEVLREGCDQYVAR